MTTTRNPVFIVVMTQGTTQLPTWGDGVRLLRQEHHLSQIQLAEMVGSSQTAISRLELGHTRSLGDRLRLRIARALHADPHELFPYLADDDDAVA